MRKRVSNSTTKIFYVGAVKSLGSTAVGSSNKSWKATEKTYTERRNHEGDRHH